MPRKRTWAPLELFAEDRVEIGVDEAGRGCLAGPVYAAAVIFPRIMPESDEEWKNIRDSKKVSAKKRVVLAEYIKRTAVSWAVGVSTAKEIDDINILQASYQAMHRAVDQVLEQVKETPDHILVDGTLFKTYRDMQGDLITHTCVPQGDNKYISIAAASILAKTERDAFMSSLCDKYPQLEPYGWKKNKSYGTKQHVAAIDEFGITRYHRQSFSTCQGRDIMELVESVVLANPS